jgi:hypothetical protein
MTSPNRLSISHLLLWIMMTGVSLACVQRGKPPTPEEYGISSDSSSPSGLADTLPTGEQQLRASWLAWQRLYLLRLIFAPVSGAALAGLVLAGGRTLTRSYGFPSQPGHWLLVVIGAMIMLAYLRPLAQSHLTQRAADGLVACTASLIFVPPLILLQQLRWRIAFGILVCAFSVLAAAFLLAIATPYLVLPNLAMIGFALMASFPVIVASSAVLDARERLNFDLFHWIGITAVFLLTLHFIAVLAIT